MIEKNWEINDSQLERLIEESEKFSLDDETNSYFISYPYFRNYFRDIKDGQIKLENLIIGIHFVYGWMPTIFELKKTKDSEKDTLEKVVKILNKAKKGNLLVYEEYTTLKELLNGSLVGSSKLLHFINPEKYAIWDSRVHRYLRETTNRGTFSYDVGDVVNYENYLKLLLGITKCSKFDKLYSPINDLIYSKYKYTITKFRAIELLMFKNGKKLKNSYSYIVQT